jgi:hypothetical protein|tara:strand:+ start:2117 stop:2320 length:204 start_codon:yes stop_codon:yes gene_type:complete
LTTLLRAQKREPNGPALFYVAIRLMTAGGDASTRKIYKQPEQDERQREIATPKLPFGPVETGFNRDP